MHDPPPGSAPKIALPQHMGGGEGLVMAGGFSHVADTAAVWVLKEDAGEMAWQQLPSLPYPMSTAGLTAVGAKGHGRQSHSDTA